MLRQLGWEIVDVWWSDLDRMDAVLADLRLAIDKAAGCWPEAMYARYRGYSDIWHTGSMRASFSRVGGRLE
jgi:hypothetical protein